MHFLNQNTMDSRIQNTAKKNTAHCGFKMVLSMITGFTQVKNINNAE